MKMDRNSVYRAITRHQNDINFRNAEMCYEDLMTTLTKYGGFLEKEDFSDTNEIALYYQIRCFIMRKTCEYIEQISKAIITMHYINNATEQNKVKNAWAGNKDLGHNLLALFKALPKEDRRTLVQAITGYNFDQEEIESIDEDKFVTLMDKTGLLENNEEIEMYSEENAPTDYSQYYKENVAVPKVIQVSEEKINEMLEGNYYTEKNKKPEDKMDTNIPEMTRDLGQAEHLVVESRYPGQAPVMGNISYLLSLAEALHNMGGKYYSVGGSFSPGK